ncbi:uncharacterized protein LOC135351421 isoform X5 [Halichondria panicea]|uniref:uncharacterized protein LOC135351421 isoform X5 n=1 Tax=Halichondria panicea TaxID=6063 RepID=UPI00312B6D4D
MIYMYYSHQQNSISQADSGNEGITPFVSLTVEGSLVGEHCPRTVRLFCKGVDLSILRWRYNGGTGIYSFSTTDLPMISILSSPAFMSVELTNVTQTPNDPRFAQFTSVLIVDIAQLQAQNVASINCGDPGTIATEPVNVIILKPSVPNNPVITAVTATYKFGLLMTLEVSWMELEEVCLEFKTSLVYMLNLTSPLSPPTVVEDDRISCRGGMCVGLFSNISENVTVVEEYTLSLSARNDMGLSKDSAYQNTIQQQSDQYFTPEILNSTSCEIFVRCVSTYTSLNNATCSVSYGMNASTVTFLLNNTKLRVLNELQSAAESHLFVFSLMVDHILRINVIKETSISGTCERKTNNADIDTIQFVVLFTLIIIVVVLMTVPIIIMCRFVVGIKHCNKSQKPKEEYPVSKNNDN